MSKRYREALSLLKERLVELERNAGDTTALADVCFGVKALESVEAGSIGGAMPQRTPAQLAVRNATSSSRAMPPGGMPSGMSAGGGRAPARFSRQSEDGGPSPVLTDLQKKAEDAEATHNPETIAALITALKAYLEEELRERPAEAPAPDGTADTAADTQVQEDFSAENIPAETPPGDEGEKPADEEKPGQKVTCEACGHEQTLQEDAATSGPARVECGDEDEMQTEAKKESAVPTAARRIAMSEANKDNKAAAAPVAPAQKPVASLTESERRELAEFRSADTARKRLEKAATAIREANAFGIKPEDLAQFSESQWPVMLSIVERPMRQPGVVTEPMPLIETEQGTRRPMDAGEYFEAQFAGGGR